MTDTIRNKGERQVNIWGKFDGTSLHALCAHSMDVAAVFETLIHLPRFQTALRQAGGVGLTIDQINTLCRLVYLHDIGKFHPDFQAKAVRKSVCNHASAGAGLIDLLQRLEHQGDAFLEPLQGLVPWQGYEDMLTAIWAHHGFPVAPTHTQPGDWAGFDARAALPYVDMMQRAFPGDLSPLPTTPRFVHYVAGLVALADWIGSDCDFFPFHEAPGADYIQIARRQAAKAVETIRLDLADVPILGDDFTTLTGFDAPNPMQATVGQLDLDSPLMILESETGSGKTEAALWYFARMFAAGHVSSLYFAVPTRTAARQLHDRVTDCMKRLFGDQAPEPVLAIPGQRVAGDAVGYALPGFRTRWEDSDKPVKHRWASEHATRFLAASIAVGTVDQALLSTLQVKHAPMRATMLARSLLVIDEVHASDAYMTRLSQQLLTDHRALGGRAMLMSATLGAAARAGYLGEAVPEVQTASAVAFPAIWRLGQGEKLTAVNSAIRSKHVTMNPLHSMAADTVANRAIDAAKRGARVLVVRNTVGEAMATYDAVIAAGQGALLLQVADGPVLHHSRFAAKDRAALDAAVETFLNPKRKSGAGGIVIGTQTLEQSLDICADLLITDLCPVDVLLQRIGRLHRHIRAYPAGFETPRCIVLHPDQGLDPLAKPGFCNGLGYWKGDDGTVKGIYTDLPCLALTAEQIAAHHIWTLPDMNRKLVEAATHPDHRAAMVEARSWQDYERDISGVAVMSNVIAGMNVLKRSRPFPPQFKGKEEHIRTRLGGDTQVVDLPDGTVGPFGHVVTQIKLTESMSRKISKEDEATITGTDPLTISIGDLRLVYDRRGIFET